MTTSGVAFSPPAETDLEQIGDYITQQNPGRAVTFILEIRAKARLIGEQPLAFPARDDITLGLRMAIRHRYMILYRPLDGLVRIERILHTARDLRRIF